MWAMIGLYNYFLFSGDTAFLAQNWARYLKAMSYIYAMVGSDGLLEGKSAGDWGRRVNSGKGSAPNML